MVSYLTFPIQSNQGKTKRVSAKYLRSRFRESKRAFLGETTKRVCEMSQGLGLKKNKRGFYFWIVGTC